MVTATEVLPEVDDDISDFDGMAHYTRVSSLVKGGVQIALCGKKWLPRTAGAEVLNMPVCPPCEEFYQMLQALYG